MNEIIQFISIIDIKFYLASSFALSISYFLLFKFSRDIASKSKKRCANTTSALVGLTIWLSHNFLLLTMYQKVSTNLWLQLGVFLACFVSIRFLLFLIPRIKALTIAKFIVVGVFFTAVIILADMYSFARLIEGALIFKPMLLLMTIFISFGIVLSALRLFLQIVQEEDWQAANVLMVLGSLITGFAVSGIPFMVLISTLDLEVFLTDSEILRDSSLFPFVFEIFLLIIIGLIPSAFGEAKIKKEKDKLNQKNQQYKSLFEQNPNAVLATDEKGYFTSINDSALQLSGYAFSELLGAHWSVIYGGDKLLSDQVEVESFLIEKIERMETKLLSKKGKKVDVDLTVIPILVNGKFAGAFGILKDITKEKLDNETIHYLAYHDELSQLPNRRHLSEKLSELVAIKEPFAIFALDFDHFKMVNDLYGHEIGDLIIKSAAERLTEKLPRHYLIARMGGDEFTILIPGNLTLSQLKALAQRILRAFEVPLQLTNLEWTITTSIGIAIHPKDGDRAEIVMKNADIALYESKEKGSNGFAFYNESLNSKVLENIKLERELKKAIENKEIMVYFQPKYHSVQKNFIGVEALARWNVKDRGPISPAIFIPIAEKSGLIVGLDRYVLRKACEQFKTLQQEGHSIQTVSVNFSQPLFYQEDIVEYVLATLKEYDLSPKRLEIEITESIAMQSANHIIKVIKELKEHGIRISLDDFGTGYSSFGHLKILPIDCLKIDRSFIKDLLVDPQNNAIVSTIITMAKNLNVDVIAEGVETKEQAEFLLKHQCYDLQGFYYSPPVSMADLDKLLKK